MAFLMRAVQIECLSPSLGLSYFPRFKISALLLQEIFFFSASLTVQEPPLSQCSLVSPPLKLAAGFSGTAQYVLVRY